MAKFIACLLAGTERAIPGYDGEVGYQTPSISGLTAYVGGYCFYGPQTPTVGGPRLRVTYDMDNLYDRIGKPFNQVTLEGGVQHDNPRGTQWFAGIRFAVGGIRDSKQVTGLARHMVDHVNRDINVVTNNNRPESYLAKNPDGTYAFSDNEGQAMVSLSIANSSNNNIIMGNSNAFAISGAIVNINQAEAQNQGIASGAMSLGTVDNNTVTGNATQGIMIDNFAAVANGATAQSRATVNFDISSFSNNVINMAGSNVSPVGINASSYASNAGLAGSSTTSNLNIGSITNNTFNFNNSINYAVGVDLENTNDQSGAGTTNSTFNFGSVGGFQNNIINFADPNFSNRGVCMFSVYAGGTTNVYIHGAPGVPGNEMDIEAANTFNLAGGTGTPVTNAGANIFN